MQCRRNISHLLCYKQISRYKSTSSHSFNDFGPGNHQNKNTGAAAQNKHVHKPYKEMQRAKRAQAHRSVLINTSSSISVPLIYKECRQYGKINHVCHFKDEKNSVLIEFASPSSVRELLSSASHFQNPQNIPVQSRLLHFQPRDLLRSSVNKLKVHTVEPPKLELSRLHFAKTISDQMQMLHLTHQISDFDSRLHFFVCSCLEDSLSGLFPHCIVEPFGSSVNGFGKSGCDLDMEVDFLPNNKDSRFQTKSKSMKFRTNKHKGNEREFAQQILQVLGDVIQHFMPTCAGVHHILNARVPIVKFFHKASSLECDLAFKNPSASQMSELLYFFGEIDDRVRPLVATVKEWAHAKNLTRSNPGPWPSNFTLIMMVLFFLQSRRQPILPTFNHLHRLAGQDERIVIDGINFSFTTNLSRLPVTQNDEGLGELLMEFFNFYTTFDFTKYALSLNDGSATSKPDSAPLYIPNLFELGHNVSRNINDSHLLGLRHGMEAAVYSLETNSNRESNNWGILSILHPGDNERPIQMRVSDLFHQDNEEDLHTSNISEMNSDAGMADSEKSNNAMRHSSEETPGREGLEDYRTLKVTESPEVPDTTGSTEHEHEHSASDNIDSQDCQRTDKTKVTGKVH
ncbi:hypothetical protein ScPMuIL_013138 [Solemya velum]